MCGGSGNVAGGSKGGGAESLGGGDTVDGESIRRANQANTIRKLEDARTKVLQRLRAVEKERDVIQSKRPRNVIQGNRKQARLNAELDAKDRPLFKRERALKNALTRISQKTGAAASAEAEMARLRDLR